LKEREQRDDRDDEIARLKSTIVGANLRYDRRAPSRARHARHYNETWLVACHGNLTPAQVRAAQSQLDQNAMADLSWLLE
jgi:hypothetical protein